MKFVFFTFDGAILPVAYKLQREGFQVVVCQIRNPEALGVKSWSMVENAEAKKRRMSLYDGLLQKQSLDLTLAMLRKEPDKDACFIVFDHSNMAKLAERVLKMDYVHGLFPLIYDFYMEKNREKAKAFVQKHYPELKLVQVETFNQVDDVIKFVEESGHLWVIKSDGNFADTLVPDQDDLDMGKAQVIAELMENKKAFQKGKILAEQKILDGIEFNAEMVFYNGKPVYSQIEIETRMLGCLDIGPQTGGNQNLTIQTQLSDPINRICFPPIVYEEARSRKGIYIRDCGILSDGEDLYFVEFAGNRWGWGGIYSELSASMNGNRIGEYFIKLANGENPYKFKYGTSLALYTLDADAKFPGLGQGDKPVTIKEGMEDDFFLYQIRKDKLKPGIVNIGYRYCGDAPLGYVTGRGDTIEAAVENLYEHVKNFSLKAVYYRPKCDFLSVETNKCILKRVAFLKEKGLIT